VTRVIYTGAFRFPDGDAAAARVLGIGKALRASGFVLEFAGWEDAEREEDRQPNGEYRFQDFAYVSQREFRLKPLSAVKRALGYFTAGQNTLKWLAAQDLRDVSAIISYHGGSVFLVQLAFLCWRRGIRLLLDCTEWYDPDGLVGGRFGLVHLDNEFRMQFLNRLIGRGIVISHFLERYYSARGCRVLRVPPLIDLSEPKWQLQSRGQNDGVLRLVYAGTPGKKDLLGSALHGLRVLVAEGHVVELHLIGPSREVVLACVDGDVGLLDALQSSLVFHGRVPQADVPGLLAMVDFSILLRPQKRYAQAGFSTKLVESLAAGVPVLANLTGDIAAYIRDGHEGILLTDYSAEAFVAGVRRILALTDAQKREMRLAARALAEQQFDFRAFVPQLGDFLSDNLVSSNAMKAKRN
jgi:glycosyltransferase involved in cell wall biosynthesis